ncbi:MAG: sigma-70 family RNA polymerase sigma factor, partial [Deltaproteobacteria bacterium]
MAEQRKLDVEDRPVAPAAESGERDEAPERESALVPADSLQRYFAEIRRIPVLSREEEHELAVRWHEKGDRPAAWKLVTSNLRLVVLVAREYQRAFHNLLDLVQEGNVGLLEAVKNFDPYRGIRFPSYAVWWIRAYIIRYIMNNWRMVKVGTTQAQRKLIFNLQKERERLEREGFSPAPKLIAQRLNVKEKEVIEMEQRLAARDVSVNAPIDPG